MEELFPADPRYTFRGMLPLEPTSLILLLALMNAVLYLTIGIFRVTRRVPLFPYLMSSVVLAAAAYLAWLVSASFGTYWEVRPVEGALWLMATGMLLLGFLVVDSVFAIGIYVLGQAGARSLRRMTAASGASAGVRVPSPPPKPSKRPAPRPRLEPEPVQVTGENAKRESPPREDLPPEQPEPTAEAAAVSPAAPTVEEELVVSPLTPEESATKEPAEESALPDPEATPVPEPESEPAAVTEPEILEVMDPVADEPSSPDESNITDSILQALASAASSVRDAVTPESYAEPEPEILVVESEEEAAAGAPPAASADAVAAAQETAVAQEPPAAEPLVPDPVQEAAEEEKREHLAQKRKKRLNEAELKRKRKEWEQRQREVAEEDAWGD